MGWGWAAVSVLLGSTASLSSCFLVCPLSSDRPLWGWGRGSRAPSVCPQPRVVPGVQWRATHTSCPGLSPACSWTLCRAWAGLWPVPESTSFLPAVLVLGQWPSRAGCVPLPTSPQRSWPTQLAPQSLCQGPAGKRLVGESVRRSQACPVLGECHDAELQVPCVWLKQGLIVIGPAAPATPQSASSPARWAFEGRMPVLPVTSTCKVLVG